MGDDTKFGTTRHGNSRGLILTLACLATLAGGCNDKSKDAGKAKAETVNPKPDTDAFDTSRLPRVAGAKEVFASPATTIFTSADPVAQTADTVEKALAAAGWQEYVAPNTARATNPDQRIVSLKKGAQGLSVFITIAPAQNNATSVQYAAVALKNDLPFPKDGSQIEYSPDRPLLTAVTADAGRADACVLSQGACLARLVAMVAKAERRSTGGRHRRRTDQERGLRLLLAGRSTIGGASAGTYRRRTDQIEVRGAAGWIFGDVAEGIFQQRQYRRRASRR